MHAPNKVILVSFLSYTELFKFEFMVVCRVFFILYVTTVLCTGILSAQETQENRPKIGLVLSGGAAKGISHIGVLKVLEEAGISVDYIGGTSMGSIVGGLYATGYDAAALEKLALTQDWTALLGDAVPLSSISIEEKNELQKYFLSFPAQGFRISLPTGLKAGQNISMLLSGLMWSYHNINDFSKLPIPFLCVATDIVEGREVVLKEGYLPDAIRASMAIPTIFTPVTIDDHLLVDGGVINNFPVKDVIDMGTDIIIGVDCGFRAYKKDEITTMAAVLEQSLYVLAAEKNETNKSLCDILIEPDFEGNEAISFSNAQGLINTGELAARKHFTELKRLADSINGIYGKREFKKYQPVHDILINSIEIEGLQNVSENLLLGKLKIKIPSRLTLSELNSAINRAFGTQFFETVTYRFDRNENGNVLRIRVKEKPSMLFRVGGHYDSDFDASLLFNAVLRNAFIKGSKLSFDIKLGRNPAFEAKYLLATSYKSSPRLSILAPAWKLGWVPDLELLFSYRNYETYSFSEGRKIARFDYLNTSAGLNLKSNLSNTHELGLGTLFEYTRIHPDIYNQPGLSDIYNLSMNVNLYLKMETYNKFVYPTKGIRSYTRLEYVQDLDARTYSNIYRVTTRFTKATPLSNRLSLLSCVYAGYINGDSVPPDYLYYSGGLVLNDYQIGVFPFVGMELFELSDKNAVTLGLDLQYEFLKNQVIQLRANVGKTTHNFNDLYSGSNYDFGYGLTYGFRSPIGPLEFTLMKNNRRKGILTYVNIGFWF